MSPPLSEQVIGCAIEVHRTLGSGFLERVYEEALAVEMRHRRVPYVRQAALPVAYHGIRVGEYTCDFLVDDRLVLELKAVRLLTAEHDAQLLNYLKAAGVSAGLLLNFGAATLGIRRRVLHHDDTCPV